jgi:branched-subunit amino acid aminotransferase/4-amino-4-deoxychorismate lyase
MHKVALINGKMVDHNEAVIPAMSAAAMYGRGVFTTLAIYDSEPFLIDKHWRRLADNAHKLNFDLKVSFEQIEIWLRELIAQNELVDGRARVTLLDSGGAGPWTARLEKPIDVVIVTGGRVKRPDKLRLTISPHTVNSSSPLAGIKSCNYLEHLMAHEEAKQRAFDEALRLNERGEITSAAMANVFWLRNDALFTPSLETGCLAGTTREFILENLDVREVCDPLDDLKSADTVFTCSAGIGVRPVYSINDVQFDSFDHPILHLLPPNTKTRMSAR